MARVKLGDVAREYKAVVKDSKNGLPVVGLENLIPKEIALTNWGIDTDNTFTKKFRKGHILFGRRRAYLEKAAVAPFDGVCSGDIIVIEAIPDKILPCLLPFIIQNDLLFDYAVEKSAGSLSPRVKWEHLKNYVFELPDKSGQLRLYSLLRAAYNTRTAYKNLLVQTDELVKSQFIEMFGNEYELDKWNCTTIENIADVIVGVVIKPAQYYTEESNGIKAFRSLNIGEMYVRDGSWVYFTPEGHAANSKSVLQTGDVLVVRSGYPGTSCVVTDEYAGCNAIDIIIARPDIRKINPVYLCAFNNLPHGQTQIKAKTGGAAQQHFNIGAYKAMTISVPPLDLQNRFSDFVQQVDKSKFELQQTIEKLDVTIKLLMQQDFS